MYTYVYIYIYIYVYIYIYIHTYNNMYPISAALVYRSACSICVIRFQSLLSLLSL